MKTNVIKEEPILSYRGCKGDFGCIEATCDIEIYAHDLKESKVGTQWTVQDQDTCPNASEFWSVSYKIVYKDNDGCCVLYTNERYDEKDMIWVELK